MSNILTITGVNAAKAGNVIQQLNTLLADLQVYYTNLRGLHWHITGRQFFLLHEQFEKMYDSTAEQVDEVAERILQLGAQPENRYSQLLKQATIQEATGVTTTEAALDLVFDNVKTLIAQERAVLEAAGEADDEVTSGLMGDYLAGLEKLVWMLQAYNA
ncbi:MAG: DNA starvation/stationary phase protection protein [Bacteroidales bacterium]|nr:DNA starvation/stationary phase protection protein [Bacteroidales bacterium]